MTSTDEPFRFDSCRARVDELLDARADMDVVERTIDAYALDREEKDALWLWASGRHERLKRQPSQPAMVGGDGHDRIW